MGKDRAISVKQSGRPPGAAAKEGPRPPGHTRRAHDRFEATGRRPADGLDAAAADDTYAPVRHPGFYQTECTLRLRKARLAAGHTSGKAAAEAHGWSVGTYLSIESGRLSLTPERAATFADAFSVPVSWLLSDEYIDAETEAGRRARMLEGLSVPQVPAVFAPPDVDAMSLSGSGARLTRARADAGFRTAREAARHLNLPASTVHAHENAQNRLSRRAAAMYAAVYGADAHWLMTGVPSDSAGKPRSCPTGGTPCAPSEIAAAVARYRGARASSAPAPSTGIARLTRDALRVLIGRAAADAARGPFLVVDVADPKHGGRARVGDRVVVDAGDRDGDGSFARSIAMGSGVTLINPMDAGRHRAPDVLGRVLLVLHSDT